MAFVPHVTCAEHGELVEASTPTSPWGRLVSSAAAPEVWADESTPEATPGHSHDHCIVTSMRRMTTFPLGLSSLVLAAPIAQPALGNSEPRLQATLPLLAVAPKSSPPRG